MPTITDRKWSKFKAILTTRNRRQQGSVSEPWDPSLSNTTSPSNPGIASASPAISPVNSGNNHGSLTQPIVEKSLWYIALEKLEQSSSIEDWNHARALRHYISTQNTFDCDARSIIERLQHAAEVKQAEAAEKAWKFQLGSRTVALRDVAARIIVWLNKFKEVGDLAVQYDPAHAALPWAAFRFMLQIVTLNSEQAGEILTGMDIATHVSVRCEVYRALYLNTGQRLGPVESLETSIIDAFTAILAYVGLAIKSYSSGSVRSTIHGLVSPEALSKCLSRIEKAENQVQEYAKLCESVLNKESRQQLGERFERLNNILIESLDKIDVNISTIEHGVSRLVRTKGDQDFCQVLQWISKIPYKTDHYNAKEGWLPGTCEWLLAHEKYMVWKESSVSTTLWLHGIPGAGKTKLSSRVIDDLLSQGKPLAYFFCSRDRADHQDPMDVLLSIVRQLSITEDGKYIKACTRKAYDEKRQEAFSSSRFTYRECRDLLLELVSEEPHTSIVIDGLDECDATNRSNILDAFDYLVRYSSTPVKIFVASRDDKDLILQYAGSPNLEIEAAHNQDDIEKLVESKISSNPWCSMEMSPYVRNEVIHLFRQKSQGMFQWAALHINDLVQLESDQAILEWLHSLPEGLKAAYDRIYAGIDRRWRRYADRAFQWLMASARPLSPEQLGILVCQDPEKAFDPQAKLSRTSLRHACQNWVKFEQDISEERCSFSHLSVHEYLEENRLEPSQAHRYIFKVSLQFWLWARSQISEEFGTTELCDLGSIFDDPWRDYAAGDCGETDEDVWQLLLDFLSECYPTAGSLAWLAWQEVSHYHESTPVFWCVKRGMNRVIKYWINHKAIDPHSESRLGLSLLMSAWEVRNREICKCLLDAGASFDAAPADMIDSYLQEIIDSAMYYERLGEDPSVLILLMKMLLERGANAEGSAHITLLQKAAYLDIGPAVLLPLLEHHAKVNVFEEPLGPPLQITTQSGDRGLESTRVLLQYGADVNQVHGYWNTVLQVAVYSNGLETVRALLENGADPNLVGGAFHAPLQAAGLWGDRSMVELLIENGADVNGIGGEYGTALHAAASRGSAGVEIYDLLVAHGADQDIEWKVRDLLSPLLYSRSLTARKARRIILDAENTG